MAQMLARKAQLRVVLTTYEYLMGKNDAPRLSRMPWTHIIIDEGVCSHIMPLTFFADFVIFTCSNCFHISQATASRTRAAS